MPPIPPTPDDADDISLVAAIRKGDNSAWNRLLTRYQHRLFTVCFRMVHDRELAADLTQDSFVKIIQGFSGFDGRAKLSTWMIRITMNTCLSALRSEKLRRHAPLDVMPGASGMAPGTRPGAAWEPSAAENVELSEQKRRLLAALTQLDDQQRAMLTLRDGRGLDYDQIAEVMDVPVGTVKSRLFRARAALREAIEKGQSERAAPKGSRPVEPGQRLRPALDPRNGVAEGGRGGGDVGSGGGSGGGVVRGVLGRPAADRPDVGKQ